MSGVFDTDATVKVSPSQQPSPSHPASTPSPQALAPLFPNLQIIELLGRGGVGAIYKARQKNLNRIVALKILPTESGGDPHFECAVFYLLQENALLQARQLNPKLERVPGELTRSSSTHAAQRCAACSTKQNSGRPFPCHGMCV